MVTNRTDINNLLSQMRDMKAQAGGANEVQARSDIEAALRVGNDNKANSATARTLPRCFPMPLTR
nr:hypothetical protein [Oceanicoccus sagamiensis]